MATVIYIPERTQSQTAMRRVIDYVVQDKKTLYEVDGRQFKLISGKDCCADVAFQEFMTTKKQYGKAVGMFFYQYVQSFSPDENITPEKAHAVGLELAEYFKGHEVLIATHIDAGQIHTHFVINSVNFETGRKLQEGPDSLLKLRKLSDEICLTHNLSVLPPYASDHSGTKGLNAREYRAATKGESWKFRLMDAIDQSMDKSATKIEFIDNMAVLGYQTNWTANRKYITYTMPDGKKCRDNKLHEEKYLKERMEGYFRELSRIKEQKQAAGNSRSGGNSAKALFPNDLRDPSRTLGGDNNAAIRAEQGHFRNAGIYEPPINTRFPERKSSPGAAKDGSKPLQGNRGMPGHVAELDRPDEIGDSGANGKHIEGYSGEDAANKPKSKRKPQGTGFIADQPSNEMDRHRRGYYDSMLGGAESSEFDLKADLQKEKQQRPLRHEQPKQRESRRKRDDWEMEM